MTKQRIFTATGGAILLAGLMFSGKPSFDQLERRDPAAAISLAESGAGDRGGRRSGL
jgi:hypothetical protein